MKKIEAVFNAIDEYDDEFGGMPTIRWLCAKVGINSTQTVHACVKKLIRCGAITLDGPRVQPVILDRSKI